MTLHRTQLISFREKLFHGPRFITLAYCVPGKRVNHYTIQAKPETKVTTSYLLWTLVTLPGF